MCRRLIWSWLGKTRRRNVKHVGSSRFPWLLHSVDLDSKISMHDQKHPTRKKKHKKSTQSPHPIYTQKYRHRQRTHRYTLWQRKVDWPQNSAGLHHHSMNPGIQDGEQINGALNHKTSWRPVKQHQRWVVVLFCFFFANTHFIVIVCSLKVTSW